MVQAAGQRARLAALSTACASIRDYPRSIHQGQLEAFPLGRLMVGYVIRQETLPERPGSTAVRRDRTLTR